MLKDEWLNFCSPWSRILLDMVVNPLKCREVDGYRVCPFRTVQQPKPGSHV